MSRRTKIGHCPRRNGNVVMVDLPTKSTMFGFLCMLSIAMLLWSFDALAQKKPQISPDVGANRISGQKTTIAGSTPDLSRKNVLILHAYTYETASSVVMDPVFLKGFTDAGLGAFNLHFEFMDLVKHPEPTHRREFVQYLRRKFAQRPIDVIIAVHRTGLKFLVEEGKDLFPGVAVINVIADPEFIGNDDFLATQVKRLSGLKRPFIILPFSIGTDPTVNCILRLKPDISTLVVVSGSDLLDKFMEGTIRRSLGAWQGRLQIEYLSGLPLNEALERVAALPPNAAILYTIFAADKERTYRNPDVAQRISEAANAPVFGLYDTLLGNGIVGGVLSHHGHEAARSVALAMEILGGKCPSEPVTISPASLVPIFDWGQLNRWGFDEKRLPQGSVVLYRPKTLWSEHKGFIIGVIVVLLGQTLLVISLLVQRRRKIAAEVSLLRKTEELDQFFNVTAELFCVASIEGYFLRMNPAAMQMLGYAAEELMANRFLDFVHPDDVVPTQEALATLALQRKLFSFENRYRCKDGTYRWLEWSSVPAGKLIYAAARDITERKQAEQTLQENERILLQNEKDLRELTGRLISAQEEERSHLARELHDDLTQRLAVLAIDAGKLEQQLMNSQGPVKEKLNDMRIQMVDLSRDVHNLARQLHPSILDDLGLVRAIESECAAFLTREGVHIVFMKENIPNVFEKDVSLTLYRIVQEGLRNISKHACANCVSVSLEGVDRSIILTVQDDGIGFDLAEANRAPCIGLSSLRERARLINGNLTIKSQLGEGTVITVEVSLIKKGRDNEKATDSVGR